MRDNFVTLSDLGHSSVFRGHFPEASLFMTPGGTVTLTCGSGAGAVTNYAAGVHQEP